MKESKSSRSQSLHIRLSDQEKQWLIAQAKATTCQNLSEYTRKKLLQKPIVTKVRNLSQDELLTEITGLRSELKSIGTNLNQMTKKLNTLTVVGDMQQWLLRFQIDKQSLLKPLEEIDSEIKKLVVKWLPS